MSEISIVVPVYKVEQYLHRCVDSLLNQSFTAFDLILVDDGSPDQCGQICDQYAEKDKRIHVIHQHNGGLSAARNSGIDWSLSNSESKWITFVDSDDWVHPQYLSLLYESVLACKTDVSVCAYKELNSGNQDYETVEDRRGAERKPEDFFVENHVNATVAWGKLYKKEYFKTLRYPVGKIHEDEFTTYVLFYKCNKVVYNTGRYYYYYQRTDSIMGGRKTSFSSDGLEAYEQMSTFFEKKGETHIVQMIKYRYLCLLKKYACELRKFGDQNVSKMLDEEYKKEYKKSIKTIQKFKRRLRLRSYRWFKINF